MDPSKNDRKSATKIFVIFLCRICFVKLSETIPLGLPLCSKSIFISSVVIRVDRLVLTPGGGLYFLLALPGFEPIVRTSGECLEILLTSVCSVFRFCAIVVRCSGTKMPSQNKFSSNLPIQWSTNWRFYNTLNVTLLIEKYSSKLIELSFVIVSADMTRKVFPKFQLRNISFYCIEKQTF